MLVSATPTCLGCSSNYSVVSASVCGCITDRMPNALSVCTLCSTLISHCSRCSVLGTCDVCFQGYSWDAVNSVCRAKFSFTSNTLSGIAFVTDFQIVLTYANAVNPSGQTIVYSVYLYDSLADYTSELPNFLLQQITVGVLY